MTAPLDWELIREAAKALGVKEVTYFQWKTRGWVPHRWRLALIKVTKGQISARDFELADRERVA